MSMSKIFIRIVNSNDSQSNIKAMHEIASAELQPRKSALSLIALLYN